MTQSRDFSAHMLLCRDFPATIPALSKSGAAMRSGDLAPLLFRFRLLFFVGGTLVLMVIIITARILAAKKRTREMAATAQQIGFRFVGNAWTGPAVSSQHQTSLLQRAGGKCTYAMTGASGGLQASLFDYTYRAGKSTVTQTLAAFSQDLPLPPFTLRPENFLDRIGDAILHNDIDFDSHPEFSKRYVLKSPDEAGTRRLFTPSLLTYLEQLQTNWCIEGSGPTLMVYRGGSRVKPFDVPAVLEETSRIARTFFASEGLRRPVA